MSHIVYSIYHQSLWVIVLLIIFSVSVYGYANCCFGKKKIWNIINLFLSAFMIYVILSTTVLNRTPGEYEIFLEPFSAFERAKEEKEMYREMIMNVFLFVPLGLALSNAMSTKIPVWVRMLITTFIGIVLSTGIEYAQYFYSIGLVETDDAICNSFGAFIGSCSLMVAKVFEKSIRTSP